MYVLGLGSELLLSSSEKQISLTQLMNFGSYRNTIANVHNMSLRKQKKKFKQVTVAFSNFDLQSSMEISSFLLDANTRVYFGSRILKLVSLLF